MRKKILAAAIILVILASFLVPAAVSADVPVNPLATPPNGNTTAVGLSLTALKAGIPATVVNLGDAITYSLSLSIPPLPAGQVGFDYIGGTLALSVGTGVHQHVAGFADTPVTSIPEVSLATPFAVNAPFTHTIVASDLILIGGKHYLSAHADYGSTADYPSGINGTFLSDPIQPTATATTSNLIQVLSPAIGVTKTRNTPVSKAGDTVNYTITVTNTGDVDLTNVTVNDTLLGNLGNSGSNVPKFVASLAIGASDSHVFPYVVKATDPDPLPNVVTVTGTDSLGAVVTAQANASVDLVHPGLTLAVTTQDTVSKPGDSVTFCVTVNNTGDVDLNLVSIASQPIVALTGFKSVLPAHTSDGPLCFNYTVKAGDPDPLTFNVTAHYSITGLPNDITATSTTSQINLVHPAIQVLKTVDQNVAVVGDTVHFTVKVTNTGDIALVLNSFVDSLSGDISSHFPGPLAPLASQTWTYAYVITALPTTNTATAHYSVAGLPNDITGTSSVTVRAPAVGGTISPESPLMIMLPWLGLGGVVILLGSAVVMRRKLFHS